MPFIREPAVSGDFYPQNPKALRKDVAGYLEAARLEDLRGDIVGVVSPHAGYMYSGQVAAYGYKALSGSYWDTVVVIAPSHRSYFEGAAVMATGAYKTPLGIIAIDEEFASALVAAEKAIFDDPEPHLKEHALEVQLPFLQVVLEEFSLVPVIIGTQPGEGCRRVAGVLAEVTEKQGKRVLVVGSTDLSHYHPYNAAVALDNIAVRDLEAFDEARMLRDFEENRFEACGGGPMLITMMASRLRGARGSKVLQYRNSGDVSGDRSAVVGYVSSVFYKQ